MVVSQEGAQPDSISDDGLGSEVHDLTGRRLPAVGSYPYRLRRVDYTLDSDCPTSGQLLIEVVDCEGGNGVSDGYGWDMMVTEADGNLAVVDVVLNWQDVGQCPD
jgi:hypothetical protein